MGGSTKEYFGDMAAYIKPDSVKDIRAKILSVSSRRKDGVLKEHILKNYTWENIAEKVIETYGDGGVR